MFGFFFKKHFLVDQLEGFIDVHNHLLPGIDDGAKTVGASIELLKGFDQFGVTNFICTPHIMHGHYNNTPKTIKASYESLEEHLKSIETLKDVTISYAAEHMIDDNFETILENNDVLPLGGNHLLIEMSYLQPSLNFETSVSKIQSHGFFPVFAHPERYSYLHRTPDKYEYYISKGLKFQLNMLSLSKFYGSSVNQMALKLLKKGYYDFLGSDIHNMHQLNTLKEIRIDQKICDSIKRLAIETSLQMTS